MDFDNIRILVIDDNPKGLYTSSPQDNPRYLGINDDPSCPQMTYSTLFDVRWVATAGEARAFKDLSRRIVERSPHLLGSAGWVPDILVIDYFLTGSPDGSVQTRLSGCPGRFEKASPLPVLKRLAAKLGVENPQGLHDEYTMGQIGTEQENQGCIIAGLLLTMFSDTPCVPIVHTVRSSSELTGSYAGFFQWLVQAESSGYLMPEGKHGDWKSILNLAMPRLRERIMQLAKQKTISVSLREITKLSAEQSQDVLTIESQYGVRRYPVQGLFCDKPLEDIPTQAKDFADEIIQEALKVRISEGRPSRQKATQILVLDELNRAQELAEILWSGYQNQQRILDRFELATLWNRWKDGKLADEKKLRTLVSKFLADNPDPKDVDMESLTQLSNCCDLRMGNYSDMVRRLASVMVIVRVLKWKDQAKRCFHKLTGAVAPQSEVFFGELTQDDVWLALFPQAKDPIGLQNLSACGWVKELARWSDSRLPELGGGINFGNLRLSIKHALDGKGWCADLGMEEFGLRPEERTLMEWYAIDQKFYVPDWDIQAKRFFWGCTDNIQQSE